MIRIQRINKLTDMHQTSGVAEWHIRHGWCYNVSCNFRHVGIFYVTLLSADAGVLHFEVVDDYLSRNPVILKCALKHCFEFSKRNLKYLFVSPPIKSKLGQLLTKFGFKKVCCYGQVQLMQLLK